MVTLQGVIILRISDFRRFFNWREFWLKKDEFMSLFKKEIDRRCVPDTEKKQEYLFVDNEKEFHLLEKLYEWLRFPDKELELLELNQSELKIGTNPILRDTISYPLGRLEQRIRSAEEITKKTRIGYTLMYLLLKADEENSDVVIDYGGIHNNANDKEINEFERRYDDLVLNIANKVEYPLRRCFIINESPNKSIRITHGNKSVTLEKEECVVGIFCENNCLILLDNELTDHESNITLKLKFNHITNRPYCNVYQQGQGITYIEDVSSIMFDEIHNIVYTTTNGKISYKEACFGLRNRIRLFNETEHANELLALKKDDGGNYIFYCINKIN